MPAEAWFWIVFMVGLLVFEAATYGLTTIWFAAGAMVAAICAAINLSMIVQIIAFLAVSVLLLFLLRPVAKRMLSANRVATNADRVYEKRGMVTEEIDNITGRGAVYVDGKTWTARSYSGQPIPADTHVSVKLIDGVKLIVEPVDIPAETPAAAVPEAKIGGGIVMPFILIALIVIILVIIVSNIRIVRQATAVVVERLGAFQAIWPVGIHFKIPFIERIARTVSLKEQVFDFAPQPVITKDNVTIQIDTVVYLQITDPKLYTYGVQFPERAIENLTATTLRNIIGDLELDQSLTSRDHINSKMRVILDEATDAWGIKVNRVELKNILPPKEIQEAMEKQMKAERERRQAILKAEGEKASQILVAEGEKQAAILRADAVRQTRILEAEGEAQAILSVQKALADSIKMVNESNPSDAVLTLKSLEAFQQAANGKATKIIIPSEIQALAGLATTMGEVLRKSE